MGGDGEDAAPGADVEHYTVGVYFGHEGCWVVICPAFVVAQCARVPRDRAQPLIGVRPRRA